MEHRLTGATVFELDLATMRPSIYYIDLYLERNFPEMALPFLIKISKSPLPLRMFGSV